VDEGGLVDGDGLHDVRLGEWIGRTCLPPPQQRHRTAIRAAALAP
jgi:hypothetical protein